MVDPRSINAHAEQERSELGGTGDYSGIQKCKPHEEATVYVHDLELFVTIQILEYTPAVLSLSKLYKEHGI